MPRIPKASFDERRKHVIDAAMICFSRKGFRQTTMQNVATEAGITPGAIYTYFKSKEDIIELAAQERRQSRIARFETASLSGGAVATLEQILKSFYQELERKNPTSESRIRPQIWADALSNDRIKDILKSSWSDIILRNAEVIQRGQEAGEINPTLSNEAVALSILCFIDGLVLHSLVDPESTNIQQCGEVFRQLLSGQFNTSQNSESVGESPQN